jgi:hypothetical protein
MKSILPKLKKKLSAFFTDESGKISKESILTMGVWAMILVWWVSEDVMASHSDFYYHDSTVPHSSGPGGHLSYPAVNTPLAWHASGSRNGSVSESAASWHLSAPHVSGVTHANHGSHASNPAAHNDVAGDGA